uniref:Uncharacterized protein LOC102807453 n=1 Tax=Saccoglossus kowalevskii TaxID=10224 RepID=A0ABM0MLJ8_SACKO|nr:PREDICTED: uncharacterized protein LOC102807453 [Saccoglossus kowalevskii]
MISYLKTIIMNLVRLLINRRRENMREVKVKKDITERTRITIKTEDTKVILRKMMCITETNKEKEAVTDMKRDIDIGTEMIIGRNREIRVLIMTDIETNTIAEIGTNIMTEIEIEEGIMRKINTKIEKGAEKEIDTIAANILQP